MKEGKLAGRMLILILAVTVAFANVTAFAADEPPQSEVSTG